MKMRYALFVFLLPFLSVAEAETIHQDLTIHLESEVFASRGDTKVTQADFDGRLSSIPESDRPGVIADPQRIHKLLDDLLLLRALANEGVRAGLLEDPSIQAAILYASTSLIAERQAESVVDEGELEDYTQQAREIWLSGSYRPKSPPKYDFTHLLISTRSHTDAEAAGIVLELNERIVQGESFDQLVAEYSEDPSAEANQGRFSEVSTDELEQRFAVALSELQTVGDISEPILSRHGWHIIRLDGLHPARDLDYEEALPFLRDVARSRHREAVRDRYYAGLINYSREISDGAVQKLLERYGVHQALADEEQ